MMCDWYVNVCTSSAHYANRKPVQLMLQDIGTGLMLTSTVLSVSACDAKPWWSHPKYAISSAT